MRGLLTKFLFFALISCSGLSVLRAESLASKNKKGNQFYSQGRYPDAEKEYLNAQVNNPGNSTILYNLGNSLIRQKKYDQAIQALNQAIEKGDKRAKENSWYNAGNALFAMGKFKDSAGAFIQALKLNPADKDAKHNLELALMKLNEQNKESKKDSGGKQDQNSGQNQNPPGNNDRQEPQNQKRENAGQNRKEQNEQAKQDMEQAPRREGTFGKDKALQILDAVQNQELDEQRKLLERRARQQAGGKDW